MHLIPSNHHYVQTGILLRQGIGNIVYKLLATLTRRSVSVPVTVAGAAWTDTERVADKLLPARPDISQDLPNIFVERVVCVDQVEAHGGM